MAYAVCMRARIVQRDHWRDNSVTGKLSIEGQEYGFKTRGHIAKAVNSQYKDVAWKPEEGDEIIIDGDVFGDQIIIDHLEPWLPQDFEPLDRYPDLQLRLINEVGKMPAMTKSLRQHKHDDDGFKVRVLRWMTPAKAQQGRQALSVIVTAIIADDEIRFAMRNVSGATKVSPDNVAILPLFASALSIPTVTIADKVKTAPAETKSSSSNKWRPGVEYRPVGMPEQNEFETHDKELDEVPF